MPSLKGKTEGIEEPKQQESKFPHFFPSGRLHDLIEGLKSLFGHLDPFRQNRQLVGGELPW